MTDRKIDCLDVGLLTPSLCALIHRDRIEINRTEVRRHRVRTIRAVVGMRSNQAYLPSENFPEGSFKGDFLCFDAQGGIIAASKASCM